MTIQTVSRRFRRFFRATEAVSALEYAILVGVVTVAIGAAVATFAENIQDVIGDIGDKVVAAEDTLGTGDLAIEE